MCTCPVLAVLVGCISCVRSTALVAPAVVAAVVAEASCELMHHFSAAQNESIDV